MRAVVVAIENAHLALAGEGAAGLHGVHRRLRARVDEQHLLDDARARLGEQLRQLLLLVPRVPVHGVHPGVVELRLDGVEHDRIVEAEDVGPEAAVPVDVPVAVDVEGVRALAPLEQQPAGALLGVGARGHREEREAAGVVRVGLRALLGERRPVTRRAACGPDQ